MCVSAIHHASDIVCRASKALDRAAREASHNRRICARVIVYATLVSAITASPKFDNARNSWMYLHIQMCVLMCVRVAHACVRA